MSNYVKLTDFASKDSLPSGNANKIVKGTELDDEFEALEASIASKYNTADTAALILTAKQSLYPVGSVYINASSATNPATLLGFGTWSEIGAGRVLVGQNTGDASFNSIGETGGSKDAVVVSHTHTGSTNTAGSHTHGLTQLATDENGFQTSAGYWSRSSSSLASYTNFTDAQGNHSHSVTVNATGSSGTNANLQPYVVVKMWQRTA